MLLNFSIRKITLQNHAQNCMVSLTEIKTKQRRKWTWKNSFIYLVGQKNARYWAPIRKSTFVIQIFLPFRSTLEARTLWEIEHDDAGVGVLIVNSRHWGKPLLPCEISSIFVENRTDGYIIELSCLTFNCTCYVPQLQLDRHVIGPGHNLQGEVNWKTSEWCSGMQRQCTMAPSSIHTGVETVDLIRSANLMWTQENMCLWEDHLYMHTSNGAFVISAVWTVDIFVYEWSFPNCWISNDNNFEQFFHGSVHLCVNSKCPKTTIVHLCSERASHSRKELSLVTQLTPWTLLVSPYHHNSKSKHNPCDSTSFFLWKSGSKQLINTRDISRKIEDKLPDINYVTCSLFVANKTPKSPVRKCDIGVTNWYYLCHMLTGAMFPWITWLCIVIQRWLLLKWGWCIIATIVPYTPRLSYPAFCQAGLPHIGSTHCPEIWNTGVKLTPINNCELGWQHFAHRIFRLPAEIVAVPEMTNIKQ